MAVVAVFALLLAGVPAAVAGAGPAVDEPPRELLVQDPGGPVREPVPVVPEASDPDRDIAEILSDPRYDVGGEGWREQLRRVWEWLRDTVRSLLFGRGGGVASRVGVGFVLLLLAALVWTVIRAGRRVARDRLALAEPAAPPAGPEEWEAQAEQAAAAGDLESAVHALFRALALRFGIVMQQPDEPGRTAGEVRRAAARTPFAEVVGTAVDAFELVAYGGRDAGAEHVAALRAANTALAPLAEAGEPIELAAHRVGAGAPR